jgi:hypothetical protein
VLLGGDAMSNKDLYKSKAWLYKRYIVERKNIVEISKEAGCSHMTIQRYLEKYGMIKGK